MRKNMGSPGLFPEYVVPGINLYSRFPFPEMVPENSQGNQERAVFRLISLPGDGQFLATSLDTAWNQVEEEFSIFWGREKRKHVDVICFRDISVRTWRNEKLQERKYLGENTFMT